MPNRKIIIIAVIVGLVLVIAGLFMTGVFSTGQNTDPNNGNSLPEYVLNADEEQKVREFVKNFVFLYNTYRYADYSNLTATGDYQTPEMQNLTLAKVDELEKTTPLGFYRTTEANEKSFTYTYPTGSTLRVTMDITVEEGIVSNSQDLRQGSATEVKYTAKAVVTLKRVSGNWLVDAVDIVRQ